MEAVCQPSNTHVQHSNMLASISDDLLPPAPPSPLPAPRPTVHPIGTASSWAVRNRTSRLDERATSILLCPSAVCRTRPVARSGQACAAEAFYTNTGRICRYVPGHGVVHFDPATCAFNASTVVNQPRAGMHVRASAQDPDDPRTLYALTQECCGRPSLLFVLQLIEVRFRECCSRFRTKLD